MSMGVHLSFFGPPGVGKGTQSQALAVKLGCEHISAGDQLRLQIKKGTAIGKEVEAILAAGNLVDPKLINKIMVQKALEARAAGQGWILDGFPRTIDQARLFSEEGWRYAVVNMQAPDSELIKRLAYRRVCPSCRRNYHLVFDPPVTDNVCDGCQSNLLQREDDRAEVVLDRLKVYRNEIEPLLGWFRKNEYDVLDIDASDGIEDVRSQLNMAIADFVYPNTSPSPTPKLA